MKKLNFMAEKIEIIVRYQDGKKALVVSPQSLHYRSSKPNSTAQDANVMPYTVQKITNRISEWKKDFQGIINAYDKYPDPTKTITANTNNLILEVRVVTRD